MGWRRRKDDEDEQPDRGREPRDRRRGDESDPDDDFGFIRNRTDRDAPRGGRAVGGRGADDEDQDSGGRNWLRRGRGDDAPDNKPARPTGRFGTGGDARRGSTGARGRGAAKADDDKGGGRFRLRGRGGDKDDEPPARSGPFVRGSNVNDRAADKRGSRGRDNVPGGRARSPIGADDSSRRSRRGSSGSRNLGGTGSRDRDPARPGSKSRTSYGGTPRGTAPLQDRDTARPGSAAGRPSYGGTQGGSSYGDRGTGTSRSPSSLRDRPGGAAGSAGSRDRDTAQPGGAAGRPTYGGAGGSSYNQRTSGTGVGDRDTAKPGGTAGRPTYGGAGSSSVRDRPGGAPGSTGIRDRNRPGGAGGDMPPRSASQRGTYGTQPGGRNVIGVGGKTGEKDEKRSSKRRSLFGRGSKGKQDDAKSSPRASQRGGRSATAGTGVRDRQSGTTGGTGFGRPGASRPGAGGTTTGRPGVGGTTPGRTGSNRPGVGGTPPGRTSRRSQPRGTTGAATGPTAGRRDSRSRTGGAAPARSRGQSRGATSTRAAPRGQAKPLPSRKEKGFTVQHGLDFDRKIDIVGVVLVAFALVTFFAVIPSVSFGVLPEATSGVTYTLNEIMSQLFGWGKLAIPIAAFWVGMWLIREIFEERGIELDYFRIVGRLMLFAGVLAWLHMIQLFDTVAPTVEEFQPYSRDLALVAGEGGGWLGHQIYFFLLSQLLDFGTISVLVAWIVMGLMLSFDVSVVEIMTFVGGLFAFVKFTGGDRAQKRAARKMLKANEVSIERPGQAPAQLGLDTAAEGKASRKRRGLRRRGKDASPDELPARPGQAPVTATAQAQSQTVDKAVPASAGTAVIATPSRPRINRRGANGDDATAPSAAPRTAPTDATLGSEPPARRPLPRMTTTTETDAVDSAADDKAAAVTEDAGQEKSGRRLFGRRGSKSSKEAEDKTTAAARAATSDTSTDSADTSRGGLRFGRRTTETDSGDKKPGIPVPPREKPTVAAANADADDNTSADARDGSESRRLRFGRRSQPDTETSGEGTPSPSADRADTPADTDTDTDSNERRGGLFGALRRSRGANKEAESASSDEAKPDAPPQKRATSDTVTPGAAAPDLAARRPSRSQPTQGTDTPPADPNRARTEQSGSVPGTPRRAFGTAPDAVPGGEAASERPSRSEARPAPGSSPSSPSERAARIDHPDRPRRPLADPLAAPAEAEADEDQAPRPGRDSVKPAARDAAADRKGPDAGDVVRAAGAVGVAALGTRERRAPIGANDRDSVADDDQTDAAPSAPQTASDRASGVSSRLDELRKMREQRRSTPRETASEDTSAETAESAAVSPMPERRAETPRVAPDDARTRPATAAATAPSERRTSSADDAAKTGNAPTVRSTPAAASPAENRTTAPPVRASEPDPEPAGKTPAQNEQPAWLQRRQSKRQAEQEARTQTETPAPDKADAADSETPPPAAERPARPAGVVSPPVPAAQRPAPPEQTPTRAAAPAAAPPERAAPPVNRRSIEGRGPSALPPAQPAATAGRGANAPDTRATRPNTAQPQQFRLPDFRKLLQQGDEQRINDEILLDKARIIEDTLASFGAPGKVVEVNPGPVITQFGVEPDYLVGRGGKKMRVKVGQIARLDADLALALAAKTIRIEAPVPGKGFVGIEVPNDEVALVGLYDIMESQEFHRLDTDLKLALGLSVDGTPVAADLTAMPHLLIAGTTGSGKSVCVNSIITALLLNNTPDQLQFIMVDPKRVELTGYNGIPHLVAPVVVELERIVGVLQWVQREMEERYRKFAAIAARNIVDYNKRVLETGGDKIPYYVVIVDELADLMMLAPDETERLLARLAQMARATGIHLIISTQRPSVDIITGLIKANFPARIAFAVASSVDSRVILDQPGAEKLLGRGDMLFQSPDAAAPLRMQGVFVSDDEIMAITRYWKGLLAEETVAAPVEVVTQRSDIKFNRLPNAGDAAGRDPSATRLTTPEDVRSSRPAQRQLWDEPTSMVDEDGDGRDDLYGEAVELVQRLNKASISLLQRRLRIGYTRAARLIDTMEAEGIVGPPQDGSKPREVLKPKIESGDD